MDPMPPSGLHYEKYHCVGHGIMVIAQNSPKPSDQSGSVCSREEPFTDCWLWEDGSFSPRLVTLEHLQEFAKIHLTNIVIWQLAKIYDK
jgi:hypothetical protein